MALFLPECFVDVTDSMDDLYQNSSLLEQFRQSSRLALRDLAGKSFERTCRLVDMFFARANEGCSSLRR